MGIFITIVLPLGFGVLGAFIGEGIKHFFSKNIEAYKTKQILKGKILDLKLNCLSVLIDHKYKFFPQYDFPDKEWSEGQEEIIDKFSDIEQALMAICRKYLSILKNTDQVAIEKLITIASNGKFHVGTDTDGRPFYSKAGREYADEYFEKLQSLIDSLKLELDI